MNLTPMRYKWYTWPHNPKVYSIDYERAMAVNKTPFGLYFLQDLDRKPRIMRGEGEFVGEDAYRQFGQLANVFYEAGPGLLVHPLWQTAKAYFVQLRVEQEPRPDYVRYSFTFWEDDSYYTGKVRALNTRDTAHTLQQQSPQESQSPVSHKVVKGDTLWAIANRYGVTVDELIKRNPQIKNPNLIHVGDEVRVK